MMRFRENEEKDCIFLAPPPHTQKGGKGAPISTMFFSSALQ